MQGNLARRGGARIDSTAYEITSPRLPASFDGFRIVQIADLHNRRFGPGHLRLLDLVRAARPDMIALTGDLTYRGEWDCEAAADLAGRLVAIAPVFFVTGNHDVSLDDLRALLTLLQDNGVTVLAGRSVAIDRRGETIFVAGIDDPRMFFDERRFLARGMDLWRARLAALRDGTREGGFTVLLSHHPELLAAYAEEGFDLVLSGHAHGGQIVLPVVGPLFAPDQGWFPRYASGVHARGGTRMVVSRGLGRSLFPWRIRNRPELVTVHLRRQGG
jgi:uncharacterized protein